MKKIFNYVMLATTFVATFVACSKGVMVEEEAPIEKEEKVEQPEKTPTTKTIQISTDVQTKTTLDSGHANLVWSTGDQISLFNNVNDDNDALTYSAGNYITVDVPVATTEVYGHYPYYSANTSGPDNVSVYISNAQTQENPGELNGANYPMVAKGTVTADNKAKMLFYPVASALALNIYHTGLVGTETVTSVKVTPTANTEYIKRQYMDLTGSGLKYTTASGSDPITVTLTNPLTLGNTKPADSQTFDGQIYVCLAKQSYTSVKFEITTSKGLYTITSNTTPFDCVTNDFVPVNINLYKASFKSLNDGNYVILSKDGDDYYAVSSSPNASSERRDCVAYSYDGGSTTSTSNANLIWSINRSGNCFTISNRGKYLSSGSNTAPLSVDAYNCVIDFGESANGYYIKNSDSSKNFKRNGTYGFGFYTSAAEELLLVPATFSGSPIVSVSSTPIELTSDDTGEKNLACEVYYASSVSAAAYVDDDSSSSLSTWLTASYSDGKITYSASSSNTTGSPRTAYIIVQATNANGTTESSAIAVTQRKAGVSLYTIYYEDFGTNSASSATALSSYKGYREATIHPATTGNWKVSKKTAVNDGTYTGCSGSSYMTTSTANDVATLVIGDISDYSNVVLSFGYLNNASAKGNRTIEVYISSDGGETWGSNIVNVSNTTQTWQFSSHDIDDSYLGNFAIKFTQNKGNTTSIDDIKITGEK